MKKDCIHTVNEIEYDYSHAYIMQGKEKVFHSDDRFNDLAYTKTWSRKKVIMGVREKFVRSYEISGEVENDGLKTIG